mmetsp:Transcript_31062/g.34752  ORF Transcript_31062/g.34752 Transcript_31062/m.34752 type:complete len:112 (-) Transcript_31062:569-904(-)
MAVVLLEIRLVVNADKVFELLRGGNKRSDVLWAGKPPQHRFEKCRHEPGRGLSRKGELVKSIVIEAGDIPLFDSHFAAWVLEDVVEEIIHFFSDPRAPSLGDLKIDQLVLF